MVVGLTVCGCMFTSLATAAVCVIPSKMQQNEKPKALSVLCQKAPKLRRRWVIHSQKKKNRRQILKLATSELKLLAGQDTKTPPNLNNYFLFLSAISEKMFIRSYI